MAGYKNYEKMSVQTSDPRAVIVLLYEGAINFLRLALAALESGDRMGMSVQIGKCQKIIHHLSTSLDFEKGEEISRNLSQLYGYMRDTLSQAGIQCEAEKIAEVVELLRPLLEAWRQVAKDPAAIAPGQPAEAKASSSEPFETMDRAPAAPVAPAPPRPGKSGKGGVFARMAESAMAARPAASLSESV